MELVKLDEELAIYYETEPFPMIRHPLVYSVPHSSYMNAAVNDALKYKKAYAHEALDDENYSRYVWIHERPHRLNALLDVERHLTRGEFRKLVIELWCDSENIYQNYFKWRRVLGDDRIRGETLRDFEGEDTKLEEMTDDNGFATVYRGTCVSKRDFMTPLISGMSWTLDKDKAIWFAHRLCASGKLPRIVVGRIHTRDIIARLEERGESEVVALRERIAFIEFFEV